MPLATSRWKDPVTRDRLIVAGILIVGWTIAAQVYVNAAPVVENPDIQEMEQSKKYVRELERMGGKMVVLTTEINAWLASLWEGRTRA